jgi:uncharacterized protein YutE (UPF0331/DUF86 family)
MADDVALAKAEILERCVERVRVVYAGDPRNLSDDLLRQESILVNLQRACEASIDGAMHLVRSRRLGLPADTRQAFDLVERAGLLDATLAERMRKMVGFRNVAVHDYRKLDLEIVRSIVERHLDDFLAFARVLIAASRDSELP